MAEAVTISIATPIVSVDTVKDGDGAAPSGGDGAVNPEAVQAQREELMRAGKSLEAAAAKLQQFQEEIFSSQQIARLSVEIAGKILQKEIGDGKYDIGKIIQEALKAAPAQQDVVVRLNGDDLKHYEKGIDEKSGDGLANVKLVADANIRPGECVVETNKGMIEYFIEEHLKKVSEALKITE
jgi:flagellar biosynthesis/type III secretory pathway protein FliH